MATVMTQGLKPQILKPLYAALKGRSSTMGVLPQRLKPVLIEAAIAGINACSTPQGTQQMGIKKGINACSTLRGTANVLGKGINACSTPARTQHGWNLTASAPTGVR